MNELMSLTMVTMDIVKSQFLSYNNGCYEQKKPLSKLEFHELQLHLEKTD